MTVPRHCRYVVHHIAQKGPGAWACLRAMWRVASKVMLALQAQTRCVPVLHARTPVDSNVARCSALKDATDARQHAAIDVLNGIAPFAAHHGHEASYRLHALSFGLRRLLWTAKSAFFAKTRKCFP